MEEKSQAKWFPKNTCKKRNRCKKPKYEYKIKSILFFFKYIISKYGNNLCVKVKNKVKIQHSRPKKPKSMRRTK